MIHTDNKLRLYRTANVFKVIFFRRVFCSYDEYSPSTNSADGISRTPDHDVFYDLATTYSFNHAYMVNTSQICPDWGYFKDGVTNGAEWYVHNLSFRNFFRVIFTSSSVSSVFP